MKKTEDKGAQPHQRLISAGFVFAGVASVFGFAAMMCLAVTAVRNGRGMDTYRTVWLVEDNWLGYLVLVGFAVTAMIVAALFRLRDHLQRRSLDRVRGDQNTNH
jgi:hypothetical protein